MTIFLGMIFSGTFGLDIAKITDDFCKIDNKFKNIKGITNNPDDVFFNCQAISNTEFEKLLNNGELFLCSDYMDYKYGCRKKEIEKVINEGKIPIIILPSSVISNFDSPCEVCDSLYQNSNRFVFLYLDSSEQNLTIPDSLSENLNIEKIRSRDRSMKKKFTYDINYHGYSLNELLYLLWVYQNCGGILSHRLIEMMISSGMLINNANIENISGASYDLCLGDEMFYAGQIHYLTEKRPFHLIEPYDYVIVTSKEEANLPKDVCARFGLSTGLFFQGLILSNGPQIDPGFEGPLFALLFNTSSSPVLLKRGQHYATIEFNKLIEPTYCYRGIHQGKKLLHYLPNNTSRGAIFELKKEVNGLQKSSSNLQSATWAILSLILAIIAIWVSLSS